MAASVRGTMLAADHQVWATKSAPLERNGLLEVGVPKEVDCASRRSLEADLGEAGDRVGRPHPTPGGDTLSIVEDSKAKTTRTKRTEGGTQISFKDWDKGQPMVFGHGRPLNGDAWANLADIYLPRCKTGGPIRESPRPMLIDGDGHATRKACFEERLPRQDGTNYPLKDVALTRVPLRRSPALTVVVTPRLGLYNPGSRPPRWSQPGPSRQRGVTGAAREGW